MEATDKDPHRDLLVTTEQKSQEAYDKTVIALSGGALGISFTIAGDLVAKPAHASWLLVTAWTLWALSLTAILWSFYLSQRAMRAAIVAHDKGKPTIHIFTDKLTGYCNFAGGTFFVLGLAAIISFVGCNDLATSQESANVKETIERQQEEAISLTEKSGPEEGQDGLSNPCNATQTSPP